MRWLLLPVLLMVAAAPDEVLTIGGERFPQSEIVDARAVGGGGGPAILITFDAAGRAKLARVTKANLNREVPVVLGGKVLFQPRIIEVIEGGAMQLDGNMGSFTEAAALAKRISGKDPLPESDGE